MMRAASRKPCQTLAVQQRRYGPPVRRGAGGRRDGVAIRSMALSRTPTIIGPIVAGTRSGNLHEPPPVERAGLPKRPRDRPEDALDRPSARMPGCPGPNRSMTKKLAD